MDRAQLDWVHYKSEAALNAKLDDQERTEQMRELYEAYLAFQRTKSPGQIAKEQQADWRLNRVRLNPRYRALLAAANGAAGDRDGAQDDR
jgi:hypothetical protein